MRSYQAHETYQTTYGHGRAAQQGGLPATIPQRQPAAEQFAGAAALAPAGGAWYPSPRILPRRPGPLPFGTPDLPDSSVQVYLDMEGLPDAGFVYLIGMLVVQGDTRTTFSFWADGKDQEVDILQQFLDEDLKPAQ